MLTNHRLSFAVVLAAAVPLYTTAAELGDSMGGGGDDIGQSLIDGTDVVRAHVLGLNRALQSAGSTLQFDVEALTSKVLASNHPAENPTTILVESTEAAETAATEAVQALCQPRPRPHPPSHSAGLHSSTPVASSP